MIGGDAEISDPATGRHGPRPPLPFWALITRETADPFAAQEALRLRCEAASLSTKDAAKLVRPQRVIDRSEMDMAF